MNDCLCQLINSGMADDRNPPLQCPEHPENYSGRRRNQFWISKKGLCLGSRPLNQAHTEIGWLWVFVAVWCIGHFFVLPLLPK